MAAKAKKPEPAKTEPKAEKAPEPVDVLSQPIDDRMAALLKDHQAMGARPK